MSKHPRSIPSHLRFFFIHVMKTGGSTFSWQIRANFERHEVYPNAELDPLQTASVSIDYLTALAPERRARIRAYRGHFPFMATQVLGMEFVTLSILRDPVERTISFLKHCQRYANAQRSSSLEQIYKDPFLYPALIRDRQPSHRSPSLEQIYEHPFVYPALIRDHQAKLFAMTPADRPRSYHYPFEIDDVRLEVAKANLERVDVLGLQERYPEFLEEMHRRYGWRVASMRDVLVGDEADVPRSFRRRIAEDNAADLEFYEHAQRLWERRHAPVAA
jgi:Sulfotransferase family